MYDFPANTGQLLNKQRIRIGNLNRGQRLDYMLQVENRLVILLEFI